MTSERTVTRISRILALIPFVLDQETVSVSELMERFGYSNQAELTRDINTILMCGLPGYFPDDLMFAFIDDDEVTIESAGFFKKAPRLTPVEALGLLAAGMTAIGSGESSPALEAAVRKLSMAVMPEAGKALAIDVSDESRNVGDLRKAASDQKVVRIVYRSVSKEELTEREIEPWSLVASLGRWYVIGHCRLVDGQRTFRVDRIKELEVLAETFQRPDDVPEPGVGYTPAADDISCVIDLQPSALWVLDYYKVDVVKSPAAVTRIEFHSPDAEVPARLLLRLGTAGRLVAGDEVADRVRSIAERLSTTYR